MTPTSPPTELDVLIVGAGFAGLYALHRARGLGLSVRVLERGDGVGGTWYWNRYPGARCDNESLDYSYSFSEELQQDWEWSERYAQQPEILRYLNHVADRFELRDDIQFGTSVTQVHHQATDDRWLVRTEQGDRFSARYCIMASGCLSSVKPPDFPGMETFEGAWYHTAQWPEEGVDFSGLKVGVVGTGSTGIQAIPRIAAQADHLTVFQRTPNFSMPARNAPLDPDVVQEVKAGYAARRELCRWSASGTANPPPTRSALEVTPEEREAAFEAGWQRGGAPAVLSAFTDVMTDTSVNTEAAEFVRRKIRSIVRDPEVAERLLPKDHPIGSKRVCVDTDYYDTFNRDNVTLVDVRSTPIEEITPTGVRTLAGLHELDALVFAIGFDAMTGALLDIDIRGVDGRALSEAWAEGPRTYLGVMTAGFPNLFMVTGPGSPSVISNMVASIEQHVDWIADCIAHLEAEGIQRIEPTIDAQDAWVQHVNEVASETLFPVANSWYMGANIPGKPRIFMPYVGGVGNYRRRCDEIAAAGYEGFASKRVRRSRTRPEGGAAGRDLSSPGPQLARLRGGP